MPPQSQSTPEIFYLPYFNSLLLTLKRLRGHEPRLPTQSPMKWVCVGKDEQRRERAFPHASGKRDDPELARTLCSAKENIVDNEIIIIIERPIHTVSRSGEIQFPAAGILFVR